MKLCTISDNKYITKIINIFLCLHYHHILLVWTQIYFNFNKNNSTIEIEKKSKWLNKRNESIFFFKFIRLKLRKLKWLNKWNELILFKIYLDWNMLNQNWWNIY